MDWQTILLTVLTVLFGGLNIFQFIFFRSTKKEYEAKAEKTAIESSDAKHDYLVKRVESMEQLYQKQGEVLDSVRKDVLRLTQDVQDRDTKIIKYESEIKLLRSNYESKIESLNAKVTKLEKEVEAYKTISGK